MVRGRFWALLLALGVAGTPVRSQDLAWQIGEGAHPTLGSIRFAGLKDAVVTPVGSHAVYSLAFLSCERKTTTIALELVNATRPDDPNALRAKAAPRLTCVQASGRAADLPVRWAVTSIGDSLARGLRPSQLRQCAAIRVAQELILPLGWGPPTAKVAFEMKPSTPELDSIFHTCGEESRLAAATPPKVAATSPPQPPKPAVAAAAPQTARTLPRGKTNVRAAPSLNSAIVAELPPDVTVVLVKQEGEWWQVRSPGRAKFEGYIRQDRLVFR